MSTWDFICTCFIAGASSFGLFVVLYIKNVSANEIFAFCQGFGGFEMRGLGVVVVIIVYGDTELIVYTGNGMDALDLEKVSYIEIRIDEYAAFSADVFIKYVVCRDHLISDVMTKEIGAELFRICSGKAAEKRHIVFFKLIQNIGKGTRLFRKDAVIIKRDGFAAVGRGTARS